MTHRSIEPALNKNRRQYIPKTQRRRLRPESRSSESHNVLQTRELHELRIRCKVSALSMDGPPVEFARHSLRNILPPVFVTLVHGSGQSWLFQWTSRSARTAFSRIAWAATMRWTRIISRQSTTSLANDACRYTSRCRWIHVFAGHFNYCLSRGRGHSLVRH